LVQAAVEELFLLVEQVEVLVLPLSLEDVGFLFPYFTPIVYMFFQFFLSGATINANILIWPITYYSPSIFFFKVPFT
jgi:hypothetical protein